MEDYERLDQAVKRNIDRFPEDFMFQLTKEEFETFVIFFYLTGVGFEVKEPPVKYKRGKKPKAKKWGHYIQMADNRPVTNDKWLMINTILSHVWQGNKMSQEQTLLWETVEKLASHDSQQHPLFHIFGKDTKK